MTSNLKRQLQTLGLGALALAAYAWFPSTVPSSIGASLYAADDETVREWTDSTGKFKVEAVLVSHDDKEIVLRKTDDRVVKIKLDKLSKKDLNYLSKLEAQDDAENPFAGGELVDEKDASDSSEFVVGGKSQEFPKVSRPVRLGDRSKAKSIRPAIKAEWKYKPADITIKKADSSRAIPVFEEATAAKQHVLEHRVLAAEEIADKAIFVGYHYGILKNQENFLERCDIVGGTSELMRVSEGQVDFVDVSPDGKYALAIQGLPDPKGGFANKSLLGIYALDKFDSENEVKPAAIFYPYYNSKQTFSLDPTVAVSDARFIDARHIFTVGDKNVAYWDLPSGRAKYIITLSTNSIVKLDPSRKFFAIFNDDKIGFYAAETGETLGVVELGGKGSALSLVLSSCEFSPSGKKFAAAIEQTVLVFDLTTGKQESSFGIEASLGAIAWADEDSILHGSLLYDIKSGLPFCKYTNLITTSGTTVNSGGLVWNVVGGLRDNSLVGAELPQAKAKEARDKLSPANFDVSPGTSVAVKIETNGLLDEGETRKLVEERLTENGFKIDPKAKIVFKASCVDTKEEEEVAYGAAQGRRLGGLIPPPPLPGLGPTNVMGTIKLKVFEQKVEFLNGSETIFTFKTLTTGPQNVEYDPDKKVEDSIKETNKPEARFYSVAPIPKYVPKKGGAGILNAKITPDGVK